MVDLTDAQRARLRDQSLMMDVEMKTIQIKDLLRKYEVSELRRDPEMEALLSDIRLKNRQISTEFWKVGIALLAAGAVLGGVVVRFLAGG